MVCFELIYKEIVEKMMLSLKIVDGYRWDIFKRLGLRNRVGLVMYVLRNKFFKI